MKSKIAFAAPSLIRTDEERHLVIETIRALSGLEIPIIITDGGSKNEDKLIIKNIPNVIFFEAKNLTCEINTSLVEAAKLADNIFYLQSDKLDFSEKFAPEMIKDYFKFEKETIFIPSRTKESFSKYPQFQQTVETFLNWVISDYVGIKNDYYLGPKIFPSSLVKYLDQIQSDIGWGIEAFLYVLAKRLNLDFKFFSCFVKFPKDVGSEEEIKLNRLKSVTRQLEGFNQGLSVKL